MRVFDKTGQTNDPDWARHQNETPKANQPGPAECAERLKSAAAPAAAERVKQRTVLLYPVPLYTVHKKRSKDLFYRTHFEPNPYHTVFQLQEADFEQKTRRTRAQP